MTEMLVIAVIALIFIGPDQLPEVARTLGRFLNDVRRSTDDLKRDFHRQSNIPRHLNSPLDQKNTDLPESPQEGRSEIAMDSEKATNNSENKGT